MTNSVTFGYLTAGPVTDGQQAGEIERSTPDPLITGDTPPDGYVQVNAGKDCCLLLTKQEYMTGLKRGKTWRRRVARARRKSFR